jgi:two-component system NtrC family sensor kinase
MASIPFLVVMGVSGFASFAFFQRYVQGHIESSTETLHATIETQLEAIVKTYLRSKVDTARDLLDAAYEPGLRAELSDPRFAATVRRLQSVRIGDTGYYYALDLEGRPVFHPDPNILGIDLSDLDPVNVQLERREGFHEYVWQNTYEPEPLPKLLYMTYLPNYELILTATAYKSDFIHIVEEESLRVVVNTVLVGDTGYSYVVDRGGNQISHPVIQGGDLQGLATQEEYDALIDLFFEVKEGYASYLWRASPGAPRREKVVYLGYLEDFDWVIGTAVYRDEISRPFTRLIWVSLGAALITVLGLSAYIARKTSGIERRLQGTLGVLREARAGDLAVRGEVSGPRELALIAEHLNYFLATLEDQTQELTSLNETLERRVADRTRDLEAATDQLVESEKRALTSRLVAGVAHEINTPIGVAVTSASYQQTLLKELEARISEGGDCSTEVSAAMGRLMESANLTIRNLERAAALITNFRTVSSEQLRLERRAFSLLATVEDAVASISPLLKDRAVAVEIDVPDGTIDGYPGVFTHAILNFLNNSLDHGFADGEGGTIRITGRRDAQDIVLEYEDNGHGIPATMKGTVFDAFVTTRRTGGNIGLGLSIVRNLVEDKLGGTIRVDSEEGKFTRFVIRFPAPGS